MKNIEKTKKMVDYHVHIGQYGTLYFQPYRVVKILKEVGVSGAFVSSTTSCMTWENREEMNLIISHIKDEFYEGCEYAKSVGFGFKPLLWCVPNMYSAGVSVTEMIRDANYCGLKIHPRANVWDFNNQATLRFCEELFEFARDKNGLFLYTQVFATLKEQTSLKNGLVCIVMLNLSCVIQRIYL